MRVKSTLFVFALLALPMLGIGELEKSDLDVKKISRTVAYSLPVFHLNQLHFDEHISTNAFDLYINSLDPSRSYFLQSDIDTFSQEAGLLHKQLRKGDIDFARNAYEILMQRIDNRMTFIEQQLEKGFDLEVEEEFLWDRKDAPWPKNEAEWNDLWRKRLKNEYIARLVSKEVYADDTNHVDTVSSNALAEAETENTNDVAQTEYDEDAEDANLSPEEFILERYKQFQLTMESFDEELILQRYLSSFSLVYDPHSDYMSPSSVEDFDINMKLSLVGIGAMLRPDDGTARIVRIIPGGPADEDGRLKAGDKIVAVAQGDEEPVSILHWPLYKAVRLIRGEKDSTVVLTVIPASDRSGTRTKKIDIVRDEVKLEEQAAKSEIKDVELDDGSFRKIGVITLPDFYADFSATSRNLADARRASTDVRRLTRELQKKGIEGLILDLRNNGGGSLVEAIDITGQFISSGPIVQVKEKKGVQVLPDADPTVEYDGPMIVLVNRLSASASEILAAALQDYKRAIIVGDRQTHGKGTVQTLMPLGDKKGSLKLTTAGFYRINGGSTQLKGVRPDIYIPDYLDVMDIGEDSLEHALPWDTIRPAMYRTNDGFEAYLPALTAQSAERLAANEEFQVYLARRERLKKRYETKTVSLSLKERLAEAEAEKELDDIQSGAFLSEDEDAENDHDLILDETLMIMSDLIDLQTLAAQDANAPSLSEK
ncbi:carboxy terminal-processing peptidase [Pontiella agarivorans]|uniref:Carboxy terminal-processing peptidase n=1 Tax=Pontiella agarivorans TaxID=3038953 RepID=A0ABU5N117_9BACT|nr:carboxy terminal-processing peptidase [Pontiella agarivorans]MDZ8120133.1 carboxy terminal-processing peptidase [Pontiella agarivorans]